MIAIASAQRLQQLLQELRTKFNCMKLQEHANTYSLCVTKFVHDRPDVAGLEIVLEGEGHAASHIYAISVVLKLTGEDALDVLYTFDVGRRTLGSKNVMKRELHRNFKFTDANVSEISGVLHQLLARDIHAVDDMFSAEAAAEPAAAAGVHEIARALDAASGHVFLKRNGRELFLTVDGSEEFDGGLKVLTTVHRNPDFHDDQFGIATFNITLQADTLHARLQKIGARTPLVDVRLPVRRFSAKAMLAAVMSVAAREGAWDELIQAEYT